MTNDKLLQAIADKRQEILRFADPTLSDIAKPAALLREYDALVTEQHQLALNTWLNDASFDEPKIRELILQFLSLNPPPSIEDAMALMAEDDAAETLSPEDSEKVGRYLLANDDLQPIIVRTLAPLIPFFREAMLGLVNKPVGGEDTACIVTDEPGETV